MTVGVLAAMASAYATPWPANMALGPAMGAVAMASMTAQAAAAKAAGMGIGMAMATGGLVTGPTVALIGEAGPEIVAPRSDYEKLIEGGTGNIHITLEMDGKRTAQVVVPHIPGVVRRAGVRGA
jgi:hypothetical protein